MVNIIKQIIYEWRNYQKLFKLKPDQRRLVFYSERDIYYQYYEGYINYILSHSDLEICYITSDKYDPIFKNMNPRIKPFYIDLFLVATLSRLDAKVLVLTLPDLDKYHIKRSKSTENHVYFFHAFGSIHMLYKKGAFRAYDTIMCVGPNHFEELRREEELYHIDRRNLIKCGYHRIEKLYRDYHQNHFNDTKIRSKSNTILIAPSWHNGNIIESCLTELIETLKGVDLQVIIRPHPEFIKRNGNIIEKLQKDIIHINNVTLELNLVNNLSIMTADVLITDWSMIAFEYAFATEKPVLFINTPRKINNPDYYELELEPVELTLRDIVGESINLQEMQKIPQLLDEFLINKQKYKDRIIESRTKYLYNWLCSDKIGGKFIIEACMD